MHPQGDTEEKGMEEAIFLILLTYCWRLMLPSWRLRLRLPN